MRRALLLLGLLAGCAPSPQAAAPATAPATALAPGWAAVLVAGDGSLPVFDNATARMAALLQSAGTPPGDIHRFSVDPGVLAQPGVAVATKARVLDGIAALRPRPGQACFVFMTSHGAHGPGLYLAPGRAFLTPAELDGALEAGCGRAPTVAVVSACYTGGFARPPMARPNRIVLTAAAADRPSFGCGAGQDLAFYDQCLLGALGALPTGWPAVISSTERCVAGLEAAEREPASNPQSAIGAAAGVPPPF